MTIPFGFASARLARYCLWPYGRTLTTDPESSGIGNVLWLLLAGWWLAAGHLLAGLALCLTLVGIPLGVAHFKLVPAALWPLGRHITTT